MNVLGPQLQELFDAFLQIQLSDKSSIAKVLKLALKLKAFQDSANLQNFRMILENLKDDGDLRVAGEILEAFQMEISGCQSDFFCQKSEKESFSGLLDTHDYKKILSEDSELLNTFFEETQENLEAIDLQLLIWEKNPKNSDCVNDIFRPFHTIKGIAGFLDITGVQSIAHCLEDRLSEIREKKDGYRKEVADLIFEGTDHLKTMVEILKTNFVHGTQNRHQIDVQEFVTRVSNKNSQKVTQKISTVEPVEEMTKPETEQPNCEAVTENLQPCDVKNPIAIPTLESENINKDPAPVLEPAESSENHLLNRNFSDLTSKILPSEPSQESSDSKSAKHSPREITQSIRVDTTKMDALIDTIGELVITHNIITQKISTIAYQDKALSSDLGQLSRIVNHLQHVSLSLRMMPIAATFQKMQRVVRHTANNLGKEIELVLKGENTEVDRTIVEEIYEPLLHMIRNACDHGIETPQERKSAGKPPCGTIVLEACHRDGCIVISIRDDGRGLNAQKIRNKAIQAGLLNANHELNHHDLYRLILQPGFSTSDTITNVSGRGVGMDVVLQTVEKLRGVISIESTPSKGSCMEIRLPLTLAIIDGMVVKVGSQEFVIPTLDVRESLHPSKESYTCSMGKGEMVLIRGQLIPLLRLHKILEIKPVFENPWDGLVVVAESDGKKYGILVDNLLGKQEIVIKSLGEMFAAAKWIAGGAVLGDGRVGIILDVSKLIQLQ